MPAYNFQAQFVDPIRLGLKRTTIRYPRLRRTRVGERLSLYTGMRTKQCRLLAHTTCLSVNLIELDFRRLLVRQGTRWLSTSEANWLAVHDGFTDVHLMFEWFRQRYGHTRVDGVSFPNVAFCGEIIEWAHPFRLPEGGAP